MQYDFALLHRKLPSSKSGAMVHVGNPLQARPLAARQRRGAARRRGGMDAYPWPGASPISNPNPKLGLDELHADCRGAEGLESALRSVHRQR
ncbi:hypothetical protein EON64_02050 [archaeon]|nr:MAG: hypothetical protein EON64_02050 [archaeon]